VTATAPGAPPAAAPPTRELWRAPAVSAGDHRLPALVDRSVADLSGLLAADPVADDDHYLTAGAPWYLTLFGRDSLWAARMALPLGTDLAAGTLRTLARRQGTRTDPSTEEEPGKILHEVRVGPAGPVRYYGTVDATPLWISLLHDAWRWGLADADVAELLPNLEAALGWLREATGDGFVRYVDNAGVLSNQGWKDSFDSIQFSDGRLAEPPIALCEVQAYAFAAAMDGAALLDAFGRPGGDENELRFAWRVHADVHSGGRRRELFLLGGQLVLTRLQADLDELAFLIGLRLEAAAGAAGHLDGDLRAVDRLPLVVLDDALDHSRRLRKGGHRDREPQEERKREQPRRPAVHAGQQDQSRVDRA